MSDCRIPGGIITLSNIYRYKGVVFEWHNYCGPMALRKDNLEPRRTDPGKRWWEIVTEWSKLTKAQKEETRIYG